MWASNVTGLAKTHAKLLSFLALLFNQSVYMFVHDHTLKGGRVRVKREGEKEREREIKRERETV